MDGDGPQAEPLEPLFNRPSKAHLLRPARVVKIHIFVAPEDDVSGRRAVGLEGLEHLGLLIRREVDGDVPRA
eukprot:11169240-Lingulodinium_polyedra.AAC.1